MNNQTPYEQIRFINEAIKDRQEKNEATFFSVKVERQGEITPMVNKEQGVNFYETILQYLTKYDLTAILIELYHGKSHNVKEPFQTFRIVLKKSPNVVISGLSGKEDVPLSQTETIVSQEKHFSELAMKERGIMGLEFENKRLLYENEVLKRKNKKKKKYIEQLETELGKVEKEKKNSLGNVSFGMIGANAIENFAKSDLGLGILKVLGAKEEFLQGIAGVKTEEKQNTNENTEQTEQRSTASIIVKKPAEEKPLTQEEKLRKALKDHITNFLNTNNDTVLRLYYEFVQVMGTDTETLSSILQQVKLYKQKQRSAQQNNSTHQGETKKAQDTKNTFTDDSEQENEIDDTS